MTNTSRLHEFALLIADCLWETDAEGRFTYASRGLAGWSATEMVGRCPHELGLASNDTANTPFHATDITHTREWRVWGKNGHARTFSVSALPLRNHDGQWCGARGVARDLTDIEIRDMALANARMRDRIVSHIVHILRDDLPPERELLAAAKSLTLTMQAEGCQIYRRHADGWETVAHYGEEAPGSVLILSNAIMNRGDALQTLSGGNEWLVCRTQVHRQVNGALAVWRRPAERAWTADQVQLMEAVADQIGMTWAQLARTEELTERAERDPLTGLLNQRAFTEQVNERMSRLQGEQAQAALLALDLDNFKVVNDHLGHQKGDEVLKDVAEALQKCIRPGDLAGRVGGDEFLLWLERADEASAQSVSERILAELATLSAALPPLPRPLGISIGVAPYESNANLNTLVRRADATMYSAKHQGKGRVEIAS